jgi:predicted metal-binding protein
MNDSLPCNRGHFANSSRVQMIALVLFPGRCPGLIIRERLRRLIAQDGDDHVLITQAIRKTRPFSIVNRL